MGTLSRMFCQVGSLVIVLNLGCSLAFPNNEDIKSGSNPCPHGWVPATYVDMGCLKFNTTDAMSWYDANTYCQQIENGSLVEIQTAEQFEFLTIQAELVDGLAGGQIIGPVLQMRVERVDVLGQQPHACGRLRVAFWTAW